MRSNSRFSPSVPSPFSFSFSFSVQCAWQQRVNDGFQSLRVPTTFKTFKSSNQICSVEFEILILAQLPVQWWCRLLPTCSHYPVIIPQSQAACIGVLSSFSTAPSSPSPSCFAAMAWVFVTLVSPTLISVVARCKHCRQWLRPNFSRENGDPCDDSDTGSL